MVCLGKYSSQLQYLLFGRIMGEKILMSSRFLKIRFLGFTKRRMASIVKEENAVALIEEEQYHAGLITGLKVMNISVEVEKDPKKFRV